MDPQGVTTATATGDLSPDLTTGRALVPIAGHALELVSQAAANPAAVKQQLMMRDALTPDQRQSAQAAAAKAYADIRVNSQVMVTFGSPATEEIDEVGRQLLRQVGGEGIEVIKGLLKDLNDGMRKIQRGYDVQNNPDARKRYERSKGRLKRWFNFGRDFLAMMIEDFQKFDTQLAKAEKKLAAEEGHMSTNFGYYEQLYKANQVAIDKLVYVIAQMEYIAEMAAQEAESITVDQSQPDWQRKREERDRLAQIAENMRIKAGDYKGIYFISIATAPQVRMSANQVLGVITKLDTVRTQTIGSMRRILAQWIMLIQSQDAMALGSFVAEQNEGWTQRYFENAPELIQQIAEGVEKPVISPQTIQIMAKSLEDSSNALVAAIDKGSQDRQAVDDAIRTALSQINAAGAKVSDETIKTVLGSVLKAVEEHQTPALPASSAPTS